MSELQIISAPQNPGEDVLDFLRGLPGPCCIYIPGQDASRCRFVVTLLHGNEPSGAHAAFRILKAGCEPVCDIYLVVMNLEAALTEPVFSFRHLPDRRDLNRCFKAPFDDHEGQLARALLDVIAEKKPEALIDIHNTSGEGPAFGVAVHLGSKHDALISLFTERLVITDIRIGALMELSEQDVPTVTVECGGADSPASHQLALDGLQRFMTREDLFNLNDAPWPVEILHNPIRLELSPSLKFVYGSSSDRSVDLVIREDIEQCNFGIVNAQTCLGWMDNDNLQQLYVRTSAGIEPVGDWFTVVEGELRPARPLKLFMVTSKAAIARSDCLLYAVRCRDADD